MNVTKFDHKCNELNNHKCNKLLPLSQGSTSLTILLFRTGWPFPGSRIVGANEDTLFRIRFSLVRSFLEQATTDLRDCCCAATVLFKFFKALLLEHDLSRFSFSVTDLWWWLLEYLWVVAGFVLNVRTYVIMPCKFGNEGWQKGRQKVEVSCAFSFSVLELLFFLYIQLLRGSSTICSG